MASLRKQKNTFACILLGDGTRTQRSTGIKDLGSPAERAAAKRKAKIVAEAMEVTKLG